MNRINDETMAVSTRIDSVAAEELLGRIIDVFTCVWRSGQWSHHDPSVSIDFVRAPFCSNSGLFQHREHSSFDLLTLGTFSDAREVSSSADKRDEVVGLDEGVDVGCEAAVFVVGEVESNTCEAAACAYGSHI